VFKAPVKSDIVGILQRQLASENQNEQFLECHCDRIPTISQVILILEHDRQMENIFRQQIRCLRI